MGLGKVAGTSSAQVSIFLLALCDWGCCHRWLYLGTMTTAYRSKHLVPVASSWLLRPDVPSLCGNLQILASLRKWALIQAFA